MLNLLVVEGLKLCAPGVSKSRCLVGAEKRPVLVGLHALHEQVVHPQAIEEVAAAGLLLACK